MSLGSAAAIGATQQPAEAVAAVLQRAGERVERYFVRAQSLVCLEIVRLLPLSATWGAEGFGRTVESELRLSWAPDADGAPTTDAQVLRQLLRVNGRKPFLNDRNNCTEPEQQTEETQPLSMLLPSRRHEYEFTLAGEARLDNR